MGNSNRILRSEQAAVLIEAVIVLPLLFFIVGSVIEIGLGMREQAGLSEGVRFTARVLAQFDAYDADPGASNRTLNDLELDVQTVMNDWMQNNNFDPAEYQVNVAPMKIILSQAKPFVRITVERNTSRGYIWESVSTSACASTVGKVQIVGVQYLPSDTALVAACG